MQLFFDRLYGNEKTKMRLGAAIKNGTLPHAFLLVGDEGSGKKTLAVEIAAALNCENHSTASALPCGRCNTCRRIYEKNFTDITYLSRTDKATIGVDEVRILREDMYLSATESPYKIYIIEEADRMTVNAQNALLKVLEEPPSSVVIFLVATSQDKILSTIKSRAQTVFLSRFSEEEIKEYLLKENPKAKNLYTASPDAFRGILMSSDGKIGKALSLLSEKAAREIEEDRGVVEKIVSALKPGVLYSELYSALSALPTGRVDFTEALESVISAIRDIIVTKSSATAEPLFFATRDDALNAGNRISLKRLNQIYDIFKAAVEDNARNVAVSAMIIDLGAKIKLI